MSEKQECKRCEERIKQHDNRVDNALSTLQDMDTDNELLPDVILDAIIGDKIPFVKWIG